MTFNFLSNLKKKRKKKETKWNGLCHYSHNPILKRRQSSDFIFRLLEAPDKKKKKKLEKKNLNK
jgi:hypothetical protein